MSLIDLARDALKEIPMSDIIRERLSLSLDRLTDAEAKIESLQTENGKLQAQLENARFDYKEAKEELQRLKDEHAEEVRIHGSIEFRRGKRTGGRWLPFCPRCHLPADDTMTVRCTQYPKGCNWLTLLGAEQVAAIAAEL